MQSELQMRNAFVAVRRELGEYARRHNGAIRHPERHRRHGIPAQPEPANE